MSGTSGGNFPFKRFSHSVDSPPATPAPAPAQQPVRQCTPPEAFASLEATSRHLREIIKSNAAGQQPLPEPTITVDGKVLPASPGFGAKVIFRPE